MTAKTIRNTIAFVFIIAIVAISAVFIWKTVKTTETGETAQLHKSEYTTAARQMDTIVDTLQNLQKYVNTLKPAGIEAREDGEDIILEKAGLDGKARVLESGEIIIRVDSENGDNTILISSIKIDDNRLLADVTTRSTGVEITESLDTDGKFEDITPRKSAEVILLRISQLYAELDKEAAKAETTTTN